MRHTVLATLICTTTGLLLPGSTTVAADVVADTNDTEVTTDADADVVLGTSWPDTAARLTPGSVVAPEGWDVEYLDGSTWTSPEPADTSGVVAVRATGSVRSEGDGGDGTTLRTETASVELSGSPAQFGTSSGGDGYDVAFPDPTRVINAFHHNGAGYAYPVTIDCTLRATGDACPEGQIVFDDDPSNPGPGPYISPNNARIGVNTTSQRAFTPVVRRSDSVLGVLCIDYSLATPAPCTPEFIPISTQSSITSLFDIGGVATDGDRIFVVNGLNHRLYCLDMETSSICPGFEERVVASVTVDGVQLPNNSPEGPTGPGSGGWGYTSDVSTIDGKLYFFQGNRPANTLGCVDPATASLCGTPSVFGNQSPFDLPPFPVYDPTGTTVIAVCVAVNRHCIDPDTSTAVTMSTDLAAFLDPATTDGIDAFTFYAVYISLAEWGFRSNRLFLPVEAGGSSIGSLWPSDLACWDFTTGAPCDFGANGDEPGIMYDVSPGLNLYSFTGDPFDDCVWSNSDSGYILAMGTDGDRCGGNDARTRFAFERSDDRLTCVAGDEQLAWKQLIISLPDNLDLADVTLTIRTADGDPVADWEGVALTSTTVDLTGLDITATGPDPLIDLDLAGAGLDIAAEISVELQSTTPPPELCLELTPVTTCVVGQTVDGRLPVPAFDITHTNSVAVGADTTTEDETVTVDDATFDAASQCGIGTLEGTTTRVGTGAPVPGVTVTLRDATTGAVIATTTTDASGNYRFEGLTPGSYTVEFGEADGLGIAGGSTTAATIVDGETARADALYSAPDPSTTTTTTTTSTTTTTTTTNPIETSSTSSPSGVELPPTGVANLATQMAVVLGALLVGSVAVVVSRRRSRPLL